MSSSALINSLPHHGALITREKCMPTELLLIIAKHALPKSLNIKVYLSPPTTEDKSKGGNHIGTYHLAATNAHDWSAFCALRRASSDIFREYRRYGIDQTHTRLVLDLTTSRHAMEAGKPRNCIPDCMLKHFDQLELRIPALIRPSTIVQYTVLHVRSSFGLQYSKITQCERLTPWLWRLLARFPALCRRNYLQEQTQSRNVLCWRLRYIPTEGDGEYTPEFFTIEIIAGILAYLELTGQKTTLPPRPGRTRQASPFIPDWNRSIGRCHGAMKWRSNPLTFASHTFDCTSDTLKVMLSSPRVDFWCRPSLRHLGLVVGIAALFFAMSSPLISIMFVLHRLVVYMGWW